MTYEDFQAARVDLERQINVKNLIAAGVARYGSLDKFAAQAGIDIDAIESTPTREHIRLMRRALAGLAVVK